MKSGSITSRMPRTDYEAIVGLNISRLKLLMRSGQHYQYALEHPRQSDAMTLGTATHVAVLEPERFSSEFAIWTNRTAGGKMSPRNGKVWEAFQELHAHRTILTADEAADAQAIAKAVRFDENANKYLALGDPEVTMQWPAGKRQFKGRADWLTTIEGEKYLVGLKTARDCRHFAFGSQAAKLGYHLQWAFYHDGYEAITGRPPHMVEIVVETEAPHAVATYVIPNDIIEQGRDEYQRLLKILDECEAADEWPGPVPHEEYLTLPTWAYPQTEEELADLELVE